MARVFRMDYAGTGDYGTQSIRVWCTAAVTAGDWIAIDSNDTTNPSALEGWSFVTADSGVEGDYDTIGVAMDTTTAAGFVTVQIAGRYDGANVADAVTLGQNLVISTTAGRAAAVAAEGTSSRIIGKALSAADANNDANVWIFPHPAFV